MKKLLCFLLFLVVNLHVTFADEIDSSYTFGIYGFVRNDMTFDTHRSLGAVNELFYFLPYDRQLDAEGNDLNEVNQLKFLGITTRLGMNFHSPLYSHGFRLSANFEADFCGAASPAIACFRLRRANVVFDWERPFDINNVTHHRLMVGQAFHPMTSELLPNIVSLNTGCPFNPFSRAPQIRYTANFPSVRLTAAAVWQFQYTSPGPKGNSNQYQFDNAAPEAYIGAEYHIPHFLIGAGAEYMAIRPRVSTEIDDNIYRVNEHVHSFAAQLYLNAGNANWDFRMKTVVGQNLGHLLMMSGYGVSGISADGRSSLYAPLLQSASWLTMTYRTNNIRHNVSATLLGGYIKNFGAGTNVSRLYTRGPENLDQMFRTSASLQYHFRELDVGAEYEYTGVHYGDVCPNATVTNTHLVNNHRLYLIVMYNFSFDWKIRKNKSI